MVARAPEGPDQSLIDLVRRYEPDRYVAALLVPAQSRNGLLAIAALSAEIARIGVEVREPMMRQIRLQWWRDILPELGAGCTIQHPTAAALKSAMRGHDLPVALLDQCLECAQNNMIFEPQMLADGGSGTIAQSTEELARIEVLLFRLAVYVLADASRTPQSDACKHAGMAYSMARQSILNVENNADNQYVMPSANLLDYKSEARRNLKTAYRLINSYDQQLRAAFHPLALVEPYLRVSERRTGLFGQAAFAFLPVRRMGRIFQAHIGRRF